MSGVIVPDYAVPDALMVPHYPPASLPLLEAVAEAAARHVGVILLSNHPAGTRAFIDRQADPERFPVVGADFDTPWIRDRSPIAVRDGAAVRWVLPKMQDMRRGRDDALFGTLSAVPTTPAPLVIAQGNLVAGPEGLAISTARLMTDNGFDDIAALTPAARELGIRRWIVIPPFRDETSGHSDVHVRLLAPELAAVAWNAGDDGDRAVAVRILDVETGLRVDCVETTLKGGEGTHFATKFAPEKGPTTLGARLWALPEIGDEAFNPKKLRKPRILGTLFVLDDTDGSEKFIFSANPGEG